MNPVALTRRITLRALDLIGINLGCRVVLIFTTDPATGTARLDTACEGRCRGGAFCHPVTTTDTAGETRVWCACESAAGSKPTGCHFVLPAHASRTDPDAYQGAGSCSGDEPCRMLRTDFDFRDGERVVELRCRCY